MFKKRIVSILFAMSLFLSVTACDFINVDNDDKKIDDAKTRSFAELTEEYFRDTAKSTTINMNFLLKEPKNYGIDEYDVLLADVSFEDKDKNVKDLEKVYTELKSFDYNKLRKEEQITYDIFKYSLESDKKFYELSDYYEPLATFNGYQTTMPYYMGEFRFYDKEQNVKDFMIMLTQFKKTFDDIMIIQKKRAEAGIFMQDFALDAVIEHCQTFIDENPNSIIASFNERIDEFNGLTDKEKQAYKDECKDKVENNVIPVYKSFIEELKTLKGSAKTSGALCEMPKGKQYYEYKYRSKVAGILSPTEMAMALDLKLNELITEYISIMGNDDTMQNLLISAQNPIPDQTAALNALMEMSKENFPDIGTIDFTIKPYPVSQEDNGSAATYFYNAIDDNSKNSIYINKKVNDPKSVKTFVVIAHEGFPGHMYQLNYFKNSDPMLVRHAIDFNGYIEGWTTYIEEYAFNYALNKEFATNKNVIRMAQIDNVLSNLLIARADIGIHYEGWSYEFYSNYLSSLYSDESIKIIYEDIIASPGTMLPYACGYIELTRLREYAENELGDKFSDIDFHKAFLDVGPAPFEIVKRELDKYIQEVKASEDTISGQIAA